ncbi:MAG: ClpXP protease specificity-enhancing factor SspB [Mariprofundaceae bacterium]|nr:ClpXP protease specificity-enhancing factor SspB [Mariprofundaceae bacterium]
MTINFTDALKAKKIRDFFNQHGRVYIVVDATSDDITLPDFLRGDPALRLVLNVRMPQPIYIRDTFIESDFSFSGAVYTCIVPMHLIWATYLPGGDMSTGFVWEEDVPETVQTVIGAVRELKDSPAPELAVLNQAYAAKKDTEAELDAEHKGRKVRHLRVVK